MLDFDRSLGWRALEERLAATQSPRQRKILGTVIDHAKAEAAFDLDGLMATLVSDPQYLAKARVYAIDDDSAHNQLPMRNTVLWSFDASGFALGKDTYSMWHPDDFRKVGRAELPKPYLDYLASIGQWA